MLMNEDDEKKKKRAERKASKVTYENGVNYNATKKRKTLIAAIGNTDAFQKHLDRKDERIWNREYKDDKNYRGYNDDMKTRNENLVQNGIYRSKHNYRMF